MPGWLRFRVDALDRAQRLYEEGQINRAAALIRVERERADAAADLLRTAEIDYLVDQMRSYLDSDDLASFDRHLRGEIEAALSDAVRGAEASDEELSEPGRSPGASVSYYARQVAMGLVEFFVFETESGWVVLVALGIFVATPAWWAMWAVTGDGYVAFLAALLFVWGPWLNSRFVPSARRPWASTLGAIAAFIVVWGATGNSKVAFTAGAMIALGGPLVAVIRQQSERR